MPSFCPSDIHPPHKLHLQRSQQGGTGQKIDEGVNNNNMIDNDTDDDERDIEWTFIMVMDDLG